MKRKRKEIIKLIIISGLIGVSCTLLGNALKKLTENYEPQLYEFASNNKIYFVLFPVFALITIYCLREYLFKKKENKGIREIYASLFTRHNELPIYKIPSHFINGLLTVVFGGSTGIEVSTVVASASLATTAHKQAKVHPIFRKELICAGVAAAVTVLFNSPIAGALFALELMLKKISKTSGIAILTAVSVAYFFNFLFGAEPLFYVHVDHWNYYALPYFLFLGFFSALNAVFLTKSILFLKAQFSKINQHFVRIIIGAFIIGFCLLIFPQLYGDGYAPMRQLFQTSVIGVGQLFIIAGILVFKPIIVSATLASGGDGGVFAPSLFIGALLGLLFASLLNFFFDAHVIPVNFMIIGMGAVLSASLHAPFTALFLACGLVDNYTLFLPLLITCLISKYTAQKILPYTVYSYNYISTK